jgi:type II secretory pathway pseudopilin PulG
MRTVSITESSAGLLGISLLEILITICVVGILAAVGLSAFDKIVPASKATIAQSIVEALNVGVGEYGQFNGDGIRRVPADGDSAAEELDILRALQWDSDTEPDPGAPYMRGDYDPTTSDEIEDYRIVWNGHFFELCEPGLPGVGLKVQFDASDCGTPVAFPQGFVPLSGY